MSPQGAPGATDYSNIVLKPVGEDDQVLGDREAKVSVIVYEDFQCPWCAKIHLEAEKEIREKYIGTGEVNLVYRDFAFLGTFVQPYVPENDESINAAQAARCAADQGKFWEYHDYLFEHHNGENQGTFSNKNLKDFAQKLLLDSARFDACLDTNKYAQAVAESKIEGSTAGVQGTPKAFILKKGKIVDTVDGYMPAAQVMAKVAKALK